MLDAFRGGARKKTAIAATSGLVPLDTPPKLTGTKKGKGGADDPI